MCRRVAVNLGITGLLLLVSLLSLWRSNQQVVRVRLTNKHPEYSKTKQGEKEQSNSIDSFETTSTSPRHGLSTSDANSIVCSGCYLVRIPGTPYTCGQVLQQRKGQSSNVTSTNHSSLVFDNDALYQISKEYSACSKCRTCIRHGHGIPSETAIMKTPFLRFDEAAPKVDFGITMPAQLFSTVPSQFRYGEPQNGETEMESSPTNSNTTSYNDTSMYFLFAYNPSIVRLPKAFQLALAKPSTDATSSPVPVYLASFRVSNVNDCRFPIPTAWKQHSLATRNSSHETHSDDGDDDDSWTPSSNDAQNDLLLDIDPRYLGLVLFSADFVILDETLVVMPPYYKGDYRLFVLKTPTSTRSNTNKTTLHDDSNVGIYIGMEHLIAQLYMGRTSDPEWHRQPNTRLLSTAFPSSSDWMVEMADFYSCCESSACEGKNFQFFQTNSLDDPQKVANQAYVETNPFGPHSVERVNLKEPCRNADPDPRTDANIANVIRDVNVSSDIEPSFATTDEEYFVSQGFYELPYTESRGTACCVSIRVPASYLEQTQTSKGLHDADANVSEDVSNQTETHVDLLVGLSHQKIPFWRDVLKESQGLNFTVRQYTYNFYAFEPKLPFRILALSGRFCLGHASHEEVASIHNNTDGSHRVGANNLVNLTLRHPVVMGDVLQCPFITFISGIVESATNPNKVILAYGINDCTSRFVQIDKSEIVRMLFHPSIQ